MRLGALVFPNVCPGCGLTNVWYASVTGRWSRPSATVKVASWPLGSPRVAEYKYAATPRPTQAGFFLRLMGDGTRMPAMAPIKAEATSGAPSRLATSCVDPTAWRKEASCWAAI